MILFKESDVLNLDFRKKVIDEINGSENQLRKRKHFKRYEIYNDRVAKYTEDLLKSYFDYSTVEEMKLSLTNVSLCRKIIDKLARVYTYGVQRELKSKRDLQKLDALEALLKVNAKMKKANRYLKLHNNIWVMCLPKPNTDANGNVLSYGLKVQILPPFLFDVIEDSNDRESAKCLIISNFNPESGFQVKYDAPERNGVRSGRSNKDSFPSGDGVDQVIADTPMDGKHNQYIFWTNAYHFTCNQKGEIISAPEGNLNPIKLIPGIALNKDQDGNYYSISGDDLVDSCLLINAMMTNINHIGIQQGYGQAYMIGKNLPSQLRLGPTKVVKMQITDDNEKAEFGFANSNAPMGDLKELTVMQIALLLSTNNLSTNGVKISLETGMQFPSGVAAMIDKAESTEDVKDQADVFLDNEKDLWDVAMRWISLYRDKDLLDERLTDINYSLDDFRLKLSEPQPIMSESEKLQNLKLRKDLGINEMVDLIMIDNPEMKRDEAEAKLLKILEEKSKLMMSSVDGTEDDLEDLEEEDEAVG